jgi:4-carboxymuconolactone decarboxylase
MAVVAAEIHEALSGTATGDPKAFGAEVGLDPRTRALARIAALIALGAPTAAYAWQVANAVDDGVTAADLLGVLRAVAPQVGDARVIAAAPEIMVALGLDSPETAGAVR